MHRLYENEDITVFWDSDRCFHARMCVSGCPGVFSFARKPWVDLSKAENPKIWKTVKTCPSGALDIVYNHGIRIAFDVPCVQSGGKCGTKIKDSSDG